MQQFGRVQFVPASAAPRSATAASVTTPARPLQVDFADRRAAWISPAFAAEVQRERGRPWPRLARAGMTRSRRPPTEQGGPPSGEPKSPSGGVKLRSSEGAPRPAESAGAGERRTARRRCSARPSRHILSHKATTRRTGDAESQRSPRRSPSPGAKTRPCARGRQGRPGRPSGAP